MNKLADILLATRNKDAVVADCVELIESHIGGRSGFKGIALKTGLSMLKSAKPGIMQRATSRLLPEFVVALEPLHQEFLRSQESDFGRFMQKRAQRATDALLAVADHRVAESGGTRVKSTYARMRGGAEAEVLAVMPGLGRVIDAYLKNAE
jgi:hypothetical protein